MNDDTDGWCKDEFFFFLSDQYGFARVAVDDTGKIVFWRLRSPGANARYAAVVFGDEVEDAFECCGDIDMSGSHSSKYENDDGAIENSESEDSSKSDGGEWDGHMAYDGENVTAKIGIRPVLWLRTE